MSGVNVNPGGVTNWTRPPGRPSIPGGGDGVITGEPGGVTGGGVTGEPGGVTNALPRVRPGELGDVTNALPRVRPGELGDVTNALPSETNEVAAA
jgi:hypothetical protein